MYNYRPYESIQVGDRVEEKVFIRQEEVEAFSHLIGDEESFHVSEEAARKTPFGKRICHGIHLAAYLSKLMGTRLPGFGTIYLEQTLGFLGPVFLDEEINVEVLVLEKLGNNKLRMETKVLNEKGEVVVKGEAIVLCHQEKGVHDESSGNFK